jgi:protoheme ferro-lyase
MGKLFAIIWGAMWRTGLVLAVIGAGLFWMNHRSGWDGRKALETQDATLEGRVGVLVVALAMPEKFDPVFFENFLDKLFTSVIPWPINVFAGADAGVALLDPTNPTAAERFEPKVLADIWGRTADIDGVPWVEKHRRGEVRFVPPSGAVAHDHGFFLYPGRKGGVRTATAKTMLKARHIMYANLPGGHLPHHAQTLAMGEAVLASLRAKRAIAAGAVGEAFDPWQLETAVRGILDAGVDTLVLASVQPIMSDFEELRGSYPKVHKIVQAWRKEHGGKPVKIVIAPMPASHESFDALWVDHMSAQLPPAAGPGQAARVVISLHGLPVSLINSDSWGARVPSVVERLSPKLAAAARAKGYAAVEVVSASEGFADPPEDPENKLVSVAEEFQRAIRDKAAVVIAVPIEFYAENTDTLFSHAAVMFDGMPGYATYQGPPADVDWSKPFVRRHRVGATEVIYAGAPGGQAAGAAGASMAQAIDTLWR